MLCQDLRDEDGLCRSVRGYSKGAGFWRRMGKLSLLRQSGKTLGVLPSSKATCDGWRWNVPKSYQVLSTYFVLGTVLED